MLFEIRLAMFGGMKKKDKITLQIHQKTVRETQNNIYKNSKQVVFQGTSSSDVSPNSVPEV